MTTNNVLHVGDILSKVNDRARDSAIEARRMMAQDHTTAEWSWQVAKTQRQLRWGMQMTPAQAKQRRDGMMKQYEDQKAVKRQHNREVVKWQRRNGTRPLKPRKARAETSFITVNVTSDGSMRDRVEGIP